MQGKIVRLRPVGLNDAEFIVSLRTDPKLSRYISSTDPSIEAQKSWLDSYLQERERRSVSQYYFITEALADNHPVGTVRLYNIDYLNKMCTWGSFIMHPSRPKGASPEAIQLSLCFAVELGMEQIVLDVRKDNKAAISLYEFCGFLRYGETNEDYLYGIALPEIYA